jgi:hypothetical protein
MGYENELIAIWQPAALKQERIGLIAEGLDQHIPKGYIYFAMAFSVMVEFLNLRTRRPKPEAVHLRQPYVPEPAVKES